jgi:hypothetical protein
LLYEILTTTISINLRAVESSITRIIAISLGHNFTNIDWKGDRLIPESKLCFRGSKLWIMVVDAYSSYCWHFQKGNTN